MRGYKWPSSLVARVLAPFEASTLLASRCQRRRKSGERLQRRCSERGRASWTASASAAPRRSGCDGVSGSEKLRRDVSREPASRGGRNAGPKSCKLEAGGGPNPREGSRSPLAAEDAERRVGPTRRTEHAALAAKAPHFLHSGCLRQACMALSQSFQCAKLPSKPVMHPVSFSLHAWRHSLLVSGSCQGRASSTDLVVSPKRR